MYTSLACSNGPEVMTFLTKTLVLKRALRQNIFVVLSVFTRNTNTSQKPKALIQCARYK